MHLSQMQVLNSIKHCDFISQISKRRQSNVFLHLVLLQDTR